MPNGFEYRVKRLVQKRQSFTASTIFNPSKGLLEAGGVVDVYLIGGGASGVVSSSNSGGNAGQSIEGRVVVTGPAPVVVGAGGAAVTVATGNNGGSSSFCGLTASGGTVFAYVANSGGAGSGGSAPVLGGLVSYDVRAPSGFCRAHYAASISVMGGPPNRFGHGFGGTATEGENGISFGSGGGGKTSGTSGAGANGYCELTWWEYEQ